MVRCGTAKCDSFVVILGPQRLGIMVSEWSPRPSAPRSVLNKETAQGNVISRCREPRTREKRSPLLSPLENWSDGDVDDDSTVIAPWSTLTCNNWRTCAMPFQSNASFEFSLVHGTRSTSPCAPEFSKKFRRRRRVELLFSNTSLARDTRST